ncbi:hypothetical protein K0M31_012375 [Melipona bicolor]|uniref:Coiled-coil domain-containing protein 86 n=1 Tax=Melipona bicolor TaxID=60889 RepID=A0AA40FJQ8_9HYME|nr:hypothetical protein K0M31_012375 [Melipona bicolor]
MRPKLRKPRKRKARYVDPVVEEERAKRVAVVQAKRQKVIDRIRLSLENRRKDKILIQNARLNKEERERQKAIRDGQKIGSEKIMLQVSSL